MRKTAAAFKKGLRARLEELFAADELVGVTNGTPDSIREPDELVGIGDATIEPPVYLAGMTQARETYDVAVIISKVTSTEETHEDNLDRCYDIAEEITDSVLDWRLEDYGGLAVTVTEGPSGDGERVEGSVRESYLELSFHVQAAI